ncbi:hypothetical protein F5B20DRAFT_501097 [Whalleya microplaca]|nr:hypothetical protein F5B20DRAFT_501097 [Whalleya microplaca]
MNGLKMKEWIINSVHSLLPVFLVWLSTHSALPLIVSSLKFNKRTCEYGARRLGMCAPNKKEIRRVAYLVITCGMSRCPDVEVWDNSYLGWGFVGGFVGGFVLLADD